MVGTNRLRRFALHAKRSICRAKDAKSTLTFMAQMGYTYAIAMEDSNMNRTATVRARLEPRLKADVEKLLHRMGMSTTEAITVFYNQIRLRQGLPFPVEVPNSTTRKTFEATDRGKDLHTYDTLDQMFEALDKC